MLNHLKPKAKSQNFAYVDSHKLEVTLKLNKLPNMYGFELEPHNLSWITGAKALKTTLFDLIANAKQRIYLVALYIENDTAGQATFDALIAAKCNNPDLDIKVFVDFHRAQRGRIGEKTSEGNAAMYRQKLQEAGIEFGVYGVPVKTKEVFGVLHLKGCLIDDNVLYTGASINNVYFHEEEKYRFDRYHILAQKELADTMGHYINHTLLKCPKIQSLIHPHQESKKHIKSFIRTYKRQLSKQHYETGFSRTGSRVTPLVGLGNRANQLNKTILAMLRSCRQEIFICTPYFNLPSSLKRVIGAKLRAGCKVDIVVGDKTANDFYIQPGEEFSIIGLVPYLYEQSLRRFLKQFQWAIQTELLNIHLWKHDNNSYHVKGLSVDQSYHLLTGNNLNPRAWALDLENALLIHDEHKDWDIKFRKEQQAILKHTQRLKGFDALESPEDYPQNVAKLLRRIRRFRLETVLKRVL